MQSAADDHEKLQDFTLEDTQSETSLINFLRGYEKMQFRPIKPADTYLFIKFSGNKILNIVLFYHYFYTSYRTITIHK